MILSVNGEEYRTETQTLGALLEELKVRPERVAVEVNLKVIRRSDFPGFRLNQGDVIEVVNFVGGGRSVASGPWKSRAAPAPPVLEDKEGA